MAKATAQPASLATVHTSHNTDTAFTSRCVHSVCRVYRVHTNTRSVHKLTNTQMRCDLKSKLVCMCARGLKTELLVTTDLRLMHYYWLWTRRLGVRIDGCLPVGRVHRAYTLSTRTVTLSTMND